MPSRANDIESILDRQEKPLRAIYSANARTRTFSPGNYGGERFVTSPKSLCRLAQDFDIIPTLASRKRMIELHREICAMQEGNSGTRAEGMSYRGFLLLLGKLAISQFQRFPSPTTIQDQLVAILRVMDRSGGIAKLVNTRGVMGIPRFRFGRQPRS